LCISIEHAGCWSFTPRCLRYLEFSIAYLIKSIYFCNCLESFCNLIFQPNWNILREIPMNLWLRILRLEYFFVKICFLFVERYVSIPFRHFSEQFLGLWNYFSRLDSKLFFQISLETRLLLTGCKNEIISQVCSLWITIITILQWYLDQNSRHNEKARTIQKRIRRIHKLRGYRRIFVYNICLINICDTDFDGAKKNISSEY